MKIFYNQARLSGEQNGLSRFGINNCYFKKLSIERDRKNITNKSHRHTGFEIHIVTDGYQLYRVGETEYRIESGDFLLIYPNISHTALSSAPSTEKYSVTFDFRLDKTDECFKGKISARFADDIDFIVKESERKREISYCLIENCLLEMIVSLFRMAGLKEKPEYKTYGENAILSLAKQYIGDNIENAPTVSEVAEYCNLSVKQLTRIFKYFEELAPGEYINKVKIEKIEEYLSGSVFTLKEISDKMNFSSEYYFNAFIKRNFGMPPGEYRKMLGR